MQRNSLTYIYIYIAYNYICMNIIDIDDIWHIHMHAIHPHLLASPFCKLLQWFESRQSQGRKAWWHLPNWARWHGTRNAVWSQGGKTWKREVNMTTSVTSHRTISHIELAAQTSKDILMHSWRDFPASTIHDQEPREIEGESERERGKQKCRPRSKRTAKPVSITFGVKFALNRHLCQIYGNLSIRLSDIGRPQNKVESLKKK